MSSCDIIPLKTVKACSGKCQGNCSKPKQTWVLAACSGMISIFSIHEGELSLVSQQGKEVAPSLVDFLQHISDAKTLGLFDRLVIVGTANDIGWARMSLSEPISDMITAEIEYPLVSGWFTQGDGMKHLNRALAHVFNA